MYNDGPLSLVRTAEGLQVAPDPADFPFLSFACAVGRSFDSMLIFGRKQKTPDQQEQLLLPRRAKLVELPAYESLLRPAQVARATPGTIRAFWRGLSNVDVVWVFGPHPFALILVGLALLRRKRVVLGIRQDSIIYFRSRLPNARWRPVLLAAYTWNAGFAALARVLRTTVVGAELARKYGRQRHRLLPMTVSLVRDADVVSQPRPKDWSGTIELLTVGRIDQEKNPLLLVEALAALEQEHPGRYRLSWAGTGPLREAVAQRASELDVREQMELLGFVPFGAQLLEKYRMAHIFVHVSLTEGVPAVLMEALASGAPVVATAVGGVSAALDQGSAGLLVPPNDLPALVAAIRRLAEDEGLRLQLVRRGLELARALTLEAEAERVARFIRA